MKIYSTIAEAAAGGLQRSVATLGVFDGVHVGHRYVLRECLRLAAERACEPVVVTFKTHPRAVIAHHAPKLITSIDHRYRLFAELGVTTCLSLDFNEELRQRTAREFAHLVFEQTLHAEVVVLGHNCSFGLNREGDADFLIRNGLEFRFETRKVPEVRIGGEICSSTMIREAIICGDLDRAAGLLGRAYSVLGTVISGDQRGRTLGFPTANLDLHHELKPPRGVYGGRVRLDQGSYFALVNIGVRPTFRGPEPGALPREMVEVHLLDFSGDLYGRDIEVVFLKRMRDEKRFAGSAELMAQIEVDRSEFKAWLGRSS